MLDKAKQIILNLAIKSGDLAKVQKIIASGNVDLTYEVKQEDVYEFNKYRFVKISEKDAQGLPAAMIKSSQMKELMLTYGVSERDITSSAIQNASELSRLIERQTTYSFSEVLARYKMNHITTQPPAQQQKKKEETFETIASQSSLSELKDFCLKHQKSPIRNFFELFLQFIHKNRLEYAEYVEGFLLSQFHKKITDFPNHESQIFKSIQGSGYVSFYNIRLLDYCKKFNVYNNKTILDFYWINDSIIFKHLVEKLEIKIDANKTMKYFSEYSCLDKSFLEIIKYLVDIHKADNFYESLRSIVSRDSSFGYNFKSIAQYLIQKGKLELGKTNILSKMLCNNIGQNIHTETIKLLMEYGAKFSQEDLISFNIIGAQCNEPSVHNKTIHFLLEQGFSPNLKFNDKFPLEMMSYWTETVYLLVIAGADIAHLKPEHKQTLSERVPKKILKYQQEIFQKYKKIILDIPEKDFELFVELVDAFDHSYKSQDSLDHHLTSVYNAIVIFNLKSSGIPKHFLDGTYDTLLQQIFQQKTGIVDKAAIHQVKIQMLALELQNPDSDKAKIADALLYLSSKEYVRDATLAKIVLKVLKSGDELPIWMGVANMDMYLDIEVDVFGKNTEIDKNSIFQGSQSIPSYREKIDFSMEMLNNLERIL